MPGLPRLRESYDFVVVGGGHAGLQAGLKAGLLDRTAVVIDRGPKYSRSFYAPRMDNLPGFPDGISGHKLLDFQIAAVRRQEERVGLFSPARATTVDRTDAGFAVTFEWLKQTQIARARAIVLAMGVVDRIPEVGGRIDTIFPWANQAIVDFCLFCDGHDLPGRSVGVIGDDAFAARTALDILEFRPRSVELLTHGRPLLAGADPRDRATIPAELAARGIPVVESEMVGFDEIREHRFGVRFADGSHRSYDRGFSALGWYDMHQEFPRALGCRFDAEGYVVTDEDCRALSAADGTPIPGVYCIGDQRNGWNQIPEAWANAERAIIHAYARFL
ncbi:MAG: NAD(P)/FAD-dependent oxidoreductase [Thermoplasmata archaeon]